MKIMVIYIDYWSFTYDGEIKFEIEKVRIGLLLLVFDHLMVFGIV